MENTPISILIVDDSYELCDCLSDHLSGIKDLAVTGVAHDGMEGYSMFQKHKPDVVLLDLIMPLMDGFSFLEQVSEDAFDHHSKIIVVSGIYEEKMINQALSLGADYFLMKPFNLNNLEKRIRSQVISRKTRAKGSNQQLKPMKTNTTKISSFDVQSTVARLLINSGIPVHTFGYKYFQCAISCLLEQNSDVFAITKMIYPYIAEKYGTSTACVDKAMRHSINLAHRDSHQVLSQFLSLMNYHDSNSKPTNSEYLSLLLERIKQEIASNAS